MNCSYVAQTKWKCLKVRVANQRPPSHAFIIYWHHLALNKSSRLIYFLLFLKSNYCQSSLVKWNAMSALISGLEDGIKDQSVVYVSIHNWIAEDPDSGNLSYVMFFFRPETLFFNQCHAMSDGSCLSTALCCISVISDFAWLWFLLLWHRQLHYKTSNKTKPNKKTNKQTKPCCNKTL